MGFNLGTFLFQVVNFLFLVYILRRLLYRPLRAAIDQRRAANAKAQADAEASRIEAEAIQRRLTQELAGLDQRRQEIIRKAREQAEAERKSLTDQTDQAIRRRREEVERQLQQDRDEALRTLQGELVTSAVALAERFLKEAAGHSLQGQLAGRLIEALRAIPEDQCQRLRDEWQPEDAAVLETAADLNGEVLAGIRGAVETLAGRSVNLSVKARPELLGGVRLMMGGHVWDASLADGLQEVRSAALPRTAP